MSNTSLDSFVTEIQSQIGEGNVRPPSALDTMTFQLEEITKRLSDLHDGQRSIEGRMTSIETSIAPVLAESQLSNPDHLQTLRVVNEPRSIAPSPLDAFRFPEHADLVPLRRSARLLAQKQSVPFTSSLKPQTESWEELGARPKDMTYGTDMDSRRRTDGFASQQAGVAPSLAAQRWVRYNGDEDVDETNVRSVGIGPENTEVDEAAMSSEIDTQRVQRFSIVREERDVEIISDRASSVNSQISDKQNRTR